jgi:RNA polymerase sigma-70 factor (ECF subfamily)
VGLEIFGLHVNTDGHVPLFVPENGENPVITIFIMDDATRDLLLAQDGDDQAFSRVIRACEEDVRRFCRWFGQCNDDVDDITQETFLRAYRGLQSFRGYATAKSWLMSIARRVCLDHAEKRSKEQSVVNGLVRKQEISVETGYSIEIRELINALPSQFREAFVLVRILGFGYDEVAAILQCPRGTVQSRVARARILLAQQVGADEIRKTS